MIGSLWSLDGEERVVRDVGDTLRLRHSRLAPDLRRVTGIPELLQALRQAPLLGLERWQIERRSPRDERNRRVSEVPDASLDITVRAAREVARATPTNAPDQGAILGVELLHALVGLDDLRSAHAHPSVLGNDDATATGGDDAAAAECPRPAADQSQHRDAGAASLDYRADDFGDREFAGVRFLDPDPAGIEQQQHGARAAGSNVGARGSQQADELRAMDFAESAAHEPTFLRGYQYLLAVEAAATHHYPVVEGASETELGEMRAHRALLRSEELDEAIRVEQPGDALAGGGFVPIGLVRLRQVAHGSFSIRRTLCMSRRVTVSGRAPPSLIENLKPPGALRSKNSWITASQIVRKPVTDVVTSTRHSWSGSARSARTSRLPDVLTPVMA